MRKSKNIRKISRRTNASLSPMIRLQISHLAQFLILKSRSLASRNCTAISLLYSSRPIRWNSNRPGSRADLFHASFTSIILGFSSLLRDQVLRRIYTRICSFKSSSNWNVTLLMGLLCHCSSASPLSSKGHTDAYGSQ